MAQSILALWLVSFKIPFLPVPRTLHCHPECTSLSTEPHLCFFYTLLVITTCLHTQTMASSTWKIPPLLPSGNDSESLEKGPQGNLTSKKLPGQFQGPARVGNNNVNTHNSLRLPTIQTSPGLYSTVHIQKPFHNWTSMDQEEGGWEEETRRKEGKEQTMFLSSLHWSGTSAEKSF